MRRNPVQKIAFAADGVPASSAIAFLGSLDSLSWQCGLAGLGCIEWESGSKLIEIDAHYSKTVFSLSRHRDGPFVLHRVNIDTLDGEDEENEEKKRKKDTGN